MHACMQACKHGFFRSKTISRVFCAPYASAMTNKRGKRGGVKTKSKQTAVATKDAQQLAEAQKFEEATKLAETKKLEEAQDEELKTKLAKMIADHFEEHESCECKVEEQEKGKGTGKGKGKSKDKQKGKSYDGEVEENKEVSVGYVRVWNPCVKPKVGGFGFIWARDRNKDKKLRDDYFSSKEKAYAVQDKVSFVTVLGNLGELIAIRDGPIP